MGREEKAHAPPTKMDLATSVTKKHGVVFHGCGYSHINDMSIVTVIPMDSYGC